MVEPWLAFSAGGSDAIPGLSEGIIFPEREESALQACLFRNKSRIREFFSEARVSKEPVLVRVLVGSKEGIEKWLKVSGPASCCLWVEISDDRLTRGIVPSSGEEFFTSQVKLAYRFRAVTASYLTILAGTFVVLAAYRKSRFELREKGGGTEVHSLFVKWLLIMPATAFHQLLCMVEPGGVLAEFQIVLRQLVDSTNFADVGFRHLDFSCWLAHFPFVLTFEGVDLLVMTRDLRWTIMRFDCSEGKLKIGKGRFSVDTSRESSGVSFYSEKAFQVHEWELWDSVSMEQDARRIGTLGAIVFNNFYVEKEGFVGGVAVRGFLDCLVNSWKEAGHKVKFIFFISGMTLFECKSSGMFPSARLSKEEQSALSKLQVSSVKERRQGLAALVELLLGGMHENGAENVIGQSVRGIVPSARDTAINWNTFHETGSDGVYASSKCCGSFSVQNNGWLRLLEWLDRRFLERLLEEALLVVDSGGRGASKVVEAFLKVIEVIPGEASSSIGAFLLTHLEDAVSSILDSVCRHSSAGKNSDQEMFSIHVEGKEGQDSSREVENLEKMVHLSNMLSAVVHGSSIAAAVFADLIAGTAVDAVIDLLQVYYFEGSRGEVSPCGDLPGEVLEQDRVMHSYPVVGAAPDTSDEDHSATVAFCPFSSSGINAILQGQQVATFKSSFQSSGFAKVLLKLVLKRVGAVSTVKGFPLPNSGRSGGKKTSLKASKAFRLMLPRGGTKEVSSNSTKASAVICHLLSAAAVMLTNRSSSLAQTRRKLVQEFKGPRKLLLISSFVEELLRTVCDGSPEKAHEHIFQIIHVLDESDEHKSQGSRYPVLMLSEIQSRIKATLSDHKARVMENDGKQTEQMLSLWEVWVALGSLLQVLSSFACKWPEEGGALLVFQRCGAEVGAVLHLLSSSEGPASWGGGELLVMQNILRLFAICMQNSHCRQRELDNLLWNTLIDKNWEFIRRYSQWVVVDACHDCTWDLLEESLWSVWEPLEFRDLSDPTGDLFSSWLPRWLPSMQCEEIPVINLVSFLRLTIGLIQRKADREKNLLLPGKTRILLEFLMNPVTGLLMKLLKGDGFSKKKMIPQKDYEAAFFHLKHVREDLRNLIPFCTQRQGISGRVPHPVPASPQESTNRQQQGTERFGGNAIEGGQVSGPASVSYNLSYLAATNLEIASLQLLASIFGLSFHGQRHRTTLSQSLLGRTAARNPFLGKAYAYPFLDFHFLRLIHLYYVNLLQGRKLKLAEPTLEKVSENSCTLAWCSDNEAPCSEAEVRDEQLSLECAVHVQVLLALAQNQSDDVTLRFKQLRVMDFLVHQIALEYEASQVATPRDVVRINKALASQLRSSASSFRTKNVGDPSARTSETSHPSMESSVSSDVTTPSVSGLKKGLCLLSPELEGSNKSCLVHKKLEKFLSKDMPKLELGFLSARTLSAVQSSSCESYLLSRPFTGRHEFLQKWQEVMKPAVPRHPVHEQASENVAFPVTVDENNLAEDIEGDFAPEKVVYTGKFFDLNEEVERELAEEDGQDRPNSENDSSDSESLTHSEDDSIGSLANEGGKASFRPFIPKLNLPRSARKGDQENTAEAKPEIQVSKPGNKSPGVSLAGDGQTSGGSCKLTTPYEMERSQRRLYRNPSLHLFLLELYITLMLTPQGTLDQRYSDRFQTEKQKLNAPFFLFYRILFYLLAVLLLKTVQLDLHPDLNHVANSYLLPCLTERMKAFHHSAFRILRLSWRGLFNSSLYRNRIRIAHGAFAQIYKATVNEEDGQRLVVLKTVELPKGPYEPCKFFDVYSEVQILEKFLGEPKISQLLDYGLESETFVLVLKHYKCSLRAWRLNQGGLHSHKSGKSFFDRLPLYLEVYAAVLDAVKVLEVHNVVHYDLKCDNVLLEPVDSVISEEEFWDPTWPPSEENSHPLPFRVCLADFGQSKASVFQGGECTVRNRGTEYVKSPEMLKLLRTGGDASLDTCVGKAVDVWGLGCLLYELLAAEYLLYDEDWMRFFIRVTTNSEELITNEKAEKVGNFGPVVEFIRFVLVRDPCRRPTLDEVMIHLRQLQESLGRPKTKAPDTDISMSCVVDAARDKPAESLEPESPKVAKKSLVSWLCCGCWNRP
ncbi:hypothetical protein SELMODRAFT_417290 [Selaginella moellendorffii]|uniref:Protein kinase domain-containing protein n=1 Tax=Selaginella moellendorffii TaxID=88036 RepID=D8S2R1_SELML|nr:hypothetical protein SELMODRAFT_417290 [Selaginella moellendorffii]